MAGSNCDERITTSLVIRVLDGDDDEWERLVLLYSPSIDRLMVRWQVPVSERDSVRNHVFAEAIKSLGGFAVQNGSKSFLAWLWAISERQVRRIGVAERSRPDRAIGGDGILSVLYRRQSEPSADDYADVLRRVLQSLGLSEGEAQLLKLYYLEGLSAAETGRRLGLTAVNVRKRAARLLKRIRDEIGDLETWLLDGF